MTNVLIPILACIAGIVIGIVIMTILSKAGLDQARNEAQSILEDSKAKAEIAARQAELDGQQKVEEIKRKADQDIQRQRDKIQAQENKLVRREDNLSFREDNLNAKEKKLDEKTKLADDKLANLARMEEDLQRKISSQMEVLERAAGLSREDAKKEIGRAFV